VFRVDQNGNEIILRSFFGKRDGRAPYGGLIRDKAGNLYGTTNMGGMKSCNCGTVFKISCAGRERVLYRFTGNNGDGASPYGGVVQDPAGNLYGTTAVGGAHGFGTIFKVDTAGHETVLHSFSGQVNDGGLSYAGLVLDRTGNLYGTTYNGGLYNRGTAFKLTP
jgi:uncharacterized repeat protein (TIGR03803 family)